MAAQVSESTIAVAFGALDLGASEQDCGIGRVAERGVEVGERGVAIALGLLDHAAGAADGGAVNAQFDRAVEVGKSPVVVVCGEIDLTTVG
jgi:hypothetical protein